MENKLVEGVLRYNGAQDRFGIWREGKGWYIDGLHCGMCFDIRLGDGLDWVPVRIEYGGNPEGWYLVGVADTVSLEGMPCRWHVGW